MSIKEGPALPTSLFNLLRQKLEPSLPIVRCTKSTLVHLSHTLEDMVLRQRMPAMIFAGFQESVYWREETERYRELVEVAQQITIFAGGLLSVENNTASLHITLNCDDPLCQEWFLVILAETFCIVLCGQDRQIDAPHEAARLFDTLWSFEPGAVNMALDHLVEVVAAYRPDRLPDLQAARAKYPFIKPDLALISEFTLQLLQFEENLHQHSLATEITLQRYQEQLEEQIAERTEALTEANQQLQRYRDHLEDLVIERTASLRTANQQLQREIVERQQAEVERERLLAAEREQRLLAETMQEIILALTSQTNHTAVLDEILRQAQRIVQHSTGNITLLRDQMMRVAFLQGYETFNAEAFVANLTQRVSDFPLERSVIESRTPLVIFDTDQEPGWVKQAETAWIKSYLIMPICLQNETLGLLRLGSDTPYKFSDEDARRLQPLANAAAIALENARLYAETQQRLKAQTALREAATIISSTLDLSGVLALIAEQMGRAIDATSAYISVFNPDSSWTVQAAYYGPGAAPQEKAVSDLGVTYIMPEDNFTYFDRLRAGQVEILHRDDPIAPKIFYNHLQQFEGQSALLIPLRFGDELVAFTGLWESRRRREFTPDEITLCQGIAQQAAIAIEHARLYDETQKLYQQTQQQARQLDQVLNTITGGIILFDSDYRIKLVNPPGLNYLLLLTGGEISQMCTHLGGHPLAELLVAPPQGSYHEVTPEGLSRPIFEIYARPIVIGPEAKGWVMVVRDVTEQRDLQKQMQQQEKLAAVGQLAAGIAHDFNNILTSVIGFAELARNTPGVPAPVIQDLGHIVQQGQRAARLVRQILDFARKNIVSKRLVNLHELLEETVNLLQRTIPETIRLELVVEPSEWGYTLNADPTQLQQALTNLAVNAADAMPSGGTLKFSLARLTQTSDRSLLCPEMTPGEWLILTVADTGVGMSPEVKKHLFEPFFTTKEVGQGTGLGLAQVEGIIKQHEGCIQVESQVGKGTIFTLHFPALPSPQPAVLYPNLLDKERQAAQGKLILLAEDNQGVLKVVEAMLKELGYHVLTAPNGQRAFEIYEKHQNNIALVITDLAMPEMGGLALAKALYSKNQAVKILGMTGYPLKVKSEELSVQGIIGWLQKPLTLEQLDHQLKRVL